MTTRTALTGFAPLLGLGFLLGGGEPASAQKLLSLAEALDLATSHNPDYRKSLNTLGLSGSRKRQAWAAFLPRPSVSLGYSVSQRRVQRVQSLFGEGFYEENPVREWQRTNNASESLGLSVTLWSGMGRFDALGQADIDAKSQRLSTEGQFLTVRAQVEQQYYQAVQRLELLNSEEELLRKRKAEFETTRVEHERAKVSKIDLVSAELEVERLEGRIREAQGGFEKALLSLRNVIGDTTLTDFTVERSLPDPFDPSGLEFEDLILRAASGNIQLRNQKISVEQSRHSLRSSKRGRWFDLSASVSVNAAESGTKFARFPDDSQGGSLSFNLSFPFLSPASHLQKSYAIAQAKVNLRNAEEDARRLRLQTDADVRSQLIDLITAHESFLLAERQVELADERVDLGEKSYRIGGATDFPRLQQYRDQASQARRDLTNYKLSFLQALQTLERTIGASITADGIQQALTVPEIR